MVKNGRIRTILVMVPILAIVLNIGEVRCQENSNNIDTEFQSQYAKKSVLEKKDDLKDDRNTGVEILEWMIKRNLNYKYSKLEPEELEDMLEKRR